MNKEQKEIIIVKSLLKLLDKVYKNDLNGLMNFIEISEEMMKDEYYIPNKMIEMPGNDLESEYELKEIMKIILGRRI